MVSSYYYDNNTAELLLVYGLICRCRICVWISFMKSENKPSCILVFTYHILRRSHLCLVWFRCVCMMREKLVTKMYKKYSCLMWLYFINKDPIYCYKKVFTYDSSMHLFICSIWFVYATDGLNRLVVIYSLWFSE